MTLDPDAGGGVAIPAGTVRSSLMSSVDRGMAEVILLVEDEEAIRDAIAYTLRQEGFTVVEAADGPDALEHARREQPALVLLDLMLPALPGLEVCRTLRSESNVPIIIVTAKDAELDRVVGLEIGADDYITKPFSMAELVSRVRALLRRRELDRAQSPTATYTVGAVEVDRVKHEVLVHDQPVHLTPSEFKLLALLSEHPEQVFTRRQIMEHLWSSVYVGDERACDVHVSSLRRKIERDPNRPERLVTVRGIGYKLMPVA
jgi:two-component system response regulator RegX3